jgi:hypothetical protein
VGGCASAAASFTTTFCADAERAVHIAHHKPSPVPRVPDDTIQDEAVGAPARSDRHPFSRESMSLKREWVAVNARRCPILKKVKQALGGVN